MSLKWTMESVWAAVAVAVTTCGGLYSTSYHWGKAAEQITAVQSHQADQDKNIDANRSALEAQKLLDAAVSQKLDDMGHQLDRIEKKL
jgi:hypothetical protein